MHLSPASIVSTPGRSSVEIRDGDDRAPRAIDVNGCRAFADRREDALTTNDEIDLHRS